MCKNDLEQPGRDKDADVVQGHLHLRPLQELPNKDGRELHAGIDRRAHGAPEWIPNAMVEPLEEALGAMRLQVLRGPIVEPGIELMDHFAIILDREEADLIGRD